MSRSRGLGLAGLAAVAVGLGLAWAASRTEPPSPTAGAEGGDGAGAAERCAFELGARATFEAEERSRVELDLGGLAAASSVGPNAALAATPAQRQDIGHDFTLATEVLETSDEGAVLAARLTTVRGVSDSADQDLGDISAPFLVRLDGRCRIRDFGWRTDGDLEAGKHQQSLVAALNFALPEGARRRYLAEAFDLTGRYRALFELADGLLRGRNVGYTSVFASGDDDAGDTPVRRSLIAVRRGADGWFDTLEHDREIGLRAAGRDVGFLRTRTMARRVDAGAEVGEVPPPSDPGWTFGLLLDRDFGAREADASSRAELARLTLSEALDRLISMVEVRGANPATYTLFMRDWLRAHPEALDALLTRIREGFFDDHPRVRAALFTALSEASTPETRAALMEIYTSDEYPFGYRLDAAQALAHTPSPPPEFLPQLVAEAQRGPADLDQASLKLTVGMFADVQEDIVPDQAAEAREAIARWLDDADDEASRVQALQAAGNAGHDSLADAIDAYTDDESAVVRRYAATAMRNLSGDEAMRRIAAALADETDPSVRLALLRAATDNAGGRGEGASGELTRLASDGLADVPGDAEYAARVALIGGAARHGDEGASATLARELERERAREELNARRLQALGRYVGNRWSARD